MDILLRGIFSVFRIVVKTFLIEQKFKTLVTNALPWVDAWKIILSSKIKFWKMYHKVSRLSYIIRFKNENAKLKMNFTNRSLIKIDQRLNSLKIFHIAWFFCKTKISSKSTPIKYCFHCPTSFRAHLTPYPF